MSSCVYSNQLLFKEDFRILYLIVICMPPAGAPSLSLRWRRICFCQFFHLNITSKQDAVSLLQERQLVDYNRRLPSRSQKHEINTKCLFATDTHFWAITGDRNNTRQ